MTDSFNVTVDTSVKGGAAGIGVLVHDRLGLVHRFGRKIGRASFLHAETRAIALALEYMAQNHPKSVVTVFSDCKKALALITGDEETEIPVIRRLISQIRELKAEFASVAFKLAHGRRLKKANRLARQVRARKQRHKNTEPLRP